jgi:peptidoglycan/LPS O-acetylase OafA/YrhL
VLAVFLRFVSGKGRVWETLGSAAFGVYILHYALVSWFQYGLLHIGGPAIVKAVLVMSGAMLSSLGVVHAWRSLRSKT